MKDKAKSARKPLLAYLSGGKFSEVPPVTSNVMRSIRSRNNRSTEIALKKLLKKNRVIGWRRHWPIEGKPDFVWPKARVALFVDGCFWHACPRHGKSPQGNREYWVHKLSRNRARDKRVNRSLRLKGWIVLRVWEHEIVEVPGKVIERICAHLYKCAKDQVPISPPGAEALRGLDSWTEQQPPNLNTR